MSFTQATIEMASAGGGFGALALTWRAIARASDKRPQRPQRPEQCPHCRALGAHRWLASTERWVCMTCAAGARPHGHPGDLDEARELRILRNAYVKGLGVSILETYTEKVLNGATVKDCLREDFDTFRTTLDGLKESLGSLSDQFPDQDSRHMIDPAHCAHFWAGAKIGCDGCGMTRQQYQDQCDREARKRRPMRSGTDAPGKVQVIERPASPVLMYERPISGEKVAVPVEQVQAIKENGAGRGVDVVLRNGQTMRNVIPRGERQRVQREFVRAGSGRRERPLNPDPSQIDRHLRKAERARAMGDTRSALAHEDEAARLNAGFSRAVWNYQ